MLWCDHIILILLCNHFCHNDDRLDWRERSWEEHHLLRDFHGLFPTCSSPISSLQVHGFRDIDECDYRQHLAWLILKPRCGDAMQQAQRARRLRGSQQNRPTSYRGPMCSSRETLASLQSLGSNRRPRVPSDASRNYILNFASIAGLGMGARAPLERKENILTKHS